MKKQKRKESDALWDGMGWDAMGCDEMCEGEE